MRFGAWQTRGVLELPGEAKDRGGWVRWEAARTDLQHFGAPVSIIGASSALRAAIRVPCAEWHAVLGT